MGRRGGGLPAYLDEPDPFNLAAKLSAKDWNVKSFSFESRVPTTIQKDSEENSALNPIDDKSSHSIDRPQTCPATKMFSLTSSSIIADNRDVRTSHNYRSISTLSKHSAMMRSPSQRLKAGHRIARSNSMEDIHNLQSVAGNRAQTVSSNDERTHFALHMDACSLPPGGFRPRPSSRGVFNSSSKTCVNMRIRGSICKKEYYEYPRSDFPPSISLKHRSIQRGKSEKGEVFQSESEVSSVRHRSEGIDNFTRGKPCEIRELGHFVSGCLFRPAMVHYIRASGWIDVTYHVGDLQHFRFNMDPRAARLPPGYQHSFSLSAPEINSPETLPKNSKELEASFSKVTEDKLDEGFMDEVQEGTSLILAERGVDLSDPLFKSTLIPPVRKPSLKEDCIYAPDYLPIPAPVAGWSKASTSTKFGIADVLAHETAIPNRLEGLRSVRIDIPSEYNPDIVDSVRVPVPPIQSNCLAVMPLVCMFLPYADIDCCINKVCTGWHVLNRWTCKKFWSCLLQRDLFWAWNLVEKANSYRKRQFCEQVTESVIKSSTSQVVAKVKAILWARARSTAYLTKEDKGQDLKKNKGRNHTNIYEHRKAKENEQGGGLETNTRDRLQSKRVDSEPLVISASANFDTWTALTVNPNVDSLSSDQSLIDPTDNGLIQDLLHSPKHIYLCASWCVRARYQKLMTQKYIESLSALKQPPISLAVFLENFSIAEQQALFSINGAIPEPCVCVAEAMFALVGHRKSDRGSSRPLSKPARASHAWKWMRRMLQTSLNIRTLKNSMRNLDPAHLEPKGWRVLHAEVALSNESFLSEGWKSIQRSPGLLSIELMRRWALSVIRFVQGRNISDNLSQAVESYEMVIKKIEIGFARGIGLGMKYHDV